MIKAYFKAVTLASLLFVASSSVWADEANRPFGIHKLQDVGLEIWVPQRPKWTLAVDSARQSAPAAILNTPELYYPATAIEIVVNKKIKVAGADLESVAKSAIREIRISAGASERIADKLKVARYGKIAGYMDQFDVDFQGDDYSMEVIVGRFETGEIITLLVTTPKGQLEHVSVMKTKIFKKLSLL